MYNPIMPSRRRHLPVIVLVLLLAWALLTIQLGAPWFGYHDENGAWVSSAVQNYHLYGAWNLRLLPTLNPGPAGPENYEIYVHQPPLVVWLAALASVPFGLNEASMRFVPASLTLVSVAAFYVLTRRLYGPRRAGVSAALYAFNPMMAYFGQMPNHEAMALATGMSYAAMLVNWLRRPSKQRFLALAVLAGIASWITWTAILYVALLTSVAVVLGKRLHRRSALILGVITLLSLAALLVFYASQYPDAIKSLLESFLYRSSSQSSGPGSAAFSWGEYARRVVLGTIILVSPGLFVLGLVGVVPVVRRTSRLSAGILIALAGVGLSYMLVFRNASFIHSYLAIYLVPPLAMGAAVVLSRAGRNRFVRPVLHGLLLASAIAGTAVLVSLHQTRTGPCCERTVEALVQHTTPDDTIMSNLHDLTSSIEFYAFRRVEWDTTPEMALSRSQANTGQYVYMYCFQQFRDTGGRLFSVNEVIIAPDPPTSPPAALTGLPYVADGGCLFIRLN